MSVTWKSSFSFRDPVEPWYKAGFGEERSVSTCTLHRTATTFWNSCYEIRNIYSVTIYTRNLVKYQAVVEQINGMLIKFRFVNKNNPKIWKSRNILKILCLYFENLRNVWRFSNFGGRGSEEFEILNKVFRTAEISGIRKISNRCRLPLYQCFKCSEFLCTNFRFVWFLAFSNFQLNDL